jgi:hypothetical protein
VEKYIVKAIVKNAGLSWMELNSSKADGDD